MVQEKPCNKCVVAKLALELLLDSHVGGEEDNVGVELGCDANIII